MLLALRARLTSSGITHTQPWHLSPTHMKRGYPSLTIATPHACQRCPGPWHASSQRSHAPAMNAAGIGAQCWKFHRESGDVQHCTRPRCRISRRHACQSETTHAIPEPRVPPNRHPHGTRACLRDSRRRDERQDRICLSLHACMACGSACVA